jgi:hypothetical protein
MGTSVAFLGLAATGINWFSNHTRVLIVFRMTPRKPTLLAAPIALQERNNNFNSYVEICV